MWRVVCAAVALAMVAVGCDGNDGGASLLHDADGNAYAVTTLPDGRMWLADNLNLERPESSCYGGTASACLEFGRLYTWASAAEACSLLGTGWRLPTDDEWRRMAKPYGGVRGDAEDDGRAAYAALLDGGVAGFNAVFGGARESDGSYTRLQAHGFYWTATENDLNTAWFYNFGRGAELLNRHGAGDKSMAMSARCIKAAQ